LGAGAAVGIVATAPVSVPFAVVGAVVGGAVGLGARLAVALPRGETGPKIDPFAVREPWRHAVIDAIRARSRFTQAVRTFRDGPLKETVAAVADRLDDAVEECWRVAQQGQLMDDARKAINDREVAVELSHAQASLAPGTTPTDTQARRIQSLESQLETAARMDALIESTKDRLDLLNARLDESVTRAIELSVSNQRAGVGGVDHDVESIVSELASLRLAMESVEGATAAGPAPATTPPPSSTKASSTKASSTQVSSTEESATGGSATGGSATGRTAPGS
jgi:hypothetical protein